MRGAARVAGAHDSGDPRVRSDITKLVGLRLRTLRTRVEELLGKSAPARVAHAILELAFRADIVASNELTGPALQRRMNAVSQMRQSVGVALMMAFMLSIGLQCVVGQEMTTAQMACCAGTDHDCGTAAAAPECCQSDGVAQELLAALVKQVVFPPALVSSPVADLASPPDTDAASGFDIDRAPLIAASPPKYVLLASFLI